MQLVSLNGVNNYEKWCTARFCDKPSIFPCLHQWSPLCDSYSQPGSYQSKLVMQKLARALGMLSKVRHCLKKAELKSIYHALFESHLYGCQFWFLSSTRLFWKKLEKLQKIKLYKLCHIQTLMGEGFILLTRGYGFRGGVYHPPFDK